MKADGRRENLNWYDYNSPRLSAQTGIEFKPNDIRSDFTYS